MSMFAAIFFCVSVAFHIIALTYLFRFLRGRVVVGPKFAFLGRFQGPMRELKGLEKSRIAVPQSALLAPDAPPYPAHWDLSTLSAQGANGILRMPQVFKVRIGDAKHREEEREFVGMADSSKQAAEFALSLVSDCESPLVLGVEKISILDV
ncbi:MAG: hypothetical protein ACHQKY_11450 [Terriglobia bacterium]